MSDKHILADIARRFETRDNRRKDTGERIFASLKIYRVIVAYQFDLELIKRLITIEVMSMYDFRH